MRILLFGHTYQPSRSEQIRHVLQTLSRTEAELVAHGDFYDFLSKEFPDVCHRIREIDCRGDYTADMALSIGGDGTFLRAAEKLCPNRFTTFMENGAFRNTTCESVSNMTERPSRLNK